MEFMILYAYLPYKKGGIERCENCTHNTKETRRSVLPHGKTYTKFPSMCA